MDEVGYLKFCVEQLGFERRLHITRADERILIADELLADIASGNASPEVSYGDGILTIRAVNRTVNYGIVSQEEHWPWWLAVRSDCSNVEP